MTRKILLLIIGLLLSGSMVFAAFDPMNMPKFDQYVEDFSSVLSPTNLATLRSRAESHNKNTTEQAVTVLFPNRNGNELADIGLKVFRENGIGQKSTNNGILLLIATEEKKIRIVTGYGMEEKVPDTLAKKWIEEDIRPRVGAGDYAGAVGAFYNRVAGAKTQVTQAPNSSPINEEYSNRISAFWIIFVLPFLLILGLLTTLIIPLNRIEEKIIRGILGRLGMGFIDIQAVKFDKRKKYLLNQESTQEYKIIDGREILYDEWDKSHLRIEEIIPKWPIYVGIIAWIILSIILGVFLLNFFLGLIISGCIFIIFLFAYYYLSLKIFIKSSEFQELLNDDSILYSVIWIGDMPLITPTSSYSGSSGDSGSDWSSGGSDSGGFDGGGGSSGGGGAGD